jgi:hypothetical protein
MKRRQLQTIPLAIIALLAGVLWPALLTAGCGPREVEAVVTLPGDVDALNLNRLWGGLAQELGVDPEGAMLDEFRLMYDGSGAIRVFNFQVVTRDRYFLQFGVAGAGVKASILGSQIAAGEPLPQSSWSVPLDTVFAAIDRVGLAALERQVTEDGSESPAGFALDIHMQDGEVQEPRAFYLEGATFVQLGADDPRRAYGAGMAVLDLAPGSTSSDGSTTTYRPLTCFIIPALAP